jgi:FAD/FMN-containing dehydrogenase
MSSSARSLAAELRSLVTGLVLTPADRRYDVVVSGLPDERRPAAIVAAACSEDVAFALRVAARRRLPAAVLPIGRPPAEEGGVLVLTTLLRTVEIDPDLSVARLAAGVAWSDLVREASRYALQPAGRGGSAATSWRDAEVLGYEVVSMAARFLQVDAGSAPELFTALRAGERPAVVTETRIRLIPAPERSWSVDDADEVVQAWSREAQLVLS